MVGSDAAVEVIYDPSSSYTRKPRSGAFASERDSFMSPNLNDMYQKPVSRESAGPLDLDSKNEEIDIRKILKDIEYLGSSNMTWKERKALENRKVVALGGKPPKKHRVPLSVAKVPMKRKKQREEKEREEGLILGRFVKLDGGDKRRVEKRRTEDRVLRASEGRFSKGVLDVKHLLQPNPPSKSDDGPHRKGKKKGKGKKKSKGKGKAKGKRRGH